MNLFMNIGHAFGTLVGRLCDAEYYPSRNGGMHEIGGSSFRIDAQETNQVTLPQDPARKTSMRYACGEALWYLAGTDNGQWMQFFSSMYRKFVVYDFSDPYGRAEGAYGPRINDSLGDLIRTLQRNPESRQAVIPIYARPDLSRTENVDHPDIPCTLSLQFLLRDHRLHMIVTMRSNDVWLGLPYDYFCFTLIQQLLARELSVAPGYVQWNAGSLHLYARNVEAARQLKPWADTETFHVPVHNGSSFPITLSMRRTMRELMADLNPRNKKQRAEFFQRDEVFSHPVADELWRAAVACNTHSKG